jgi:hypothetical protein
LDVMSWQKDPPLVSRGRAGEKLVAAHGAHVHHLLYTLFIE